MSAAWASLLVRKARLDWRRLPPSCHGRERPRTMPPRRSHDGRSSHWPQDRVTNALPRAEVAGRSQLSMGNYQVFCTAPGRDRTCDARFRKRLGAVRLDSSEFVNMWLSAGHSASFGVAAVRRHSPRFGERRYHGVTTNRLSEPRPAPQLKRRHLDGGRGLAAACRIERRSQPASSPRISSTAMGPQSRGAADSPSVILGVEVFGLSNASGIQE